MDIKNYLENYYKNIDRPMIYNCINNLNLNKVLELSAIIKLYIFTNKKKDKWELKDKKILLKECNTIRKLKIKEIYNLLTQLSKNKSNNLILEIKKKNTSLLDEIEIIDLLINTIEIDYPIINNNFLEKFSN
jgi:hypothetical protein